MHHDPDLEVSNKLFKSGGVMGRLDFFFAHLKLTGFTLLACTPILIGVALFGEKGKLIGTVMAAVAGLPVFVAYYYTMFKRLRDIRGSTEKQVGYQTALVISMLIPVISLVPTLALFFMPGKITSGKGPSNDHHSSDHKKVIPLRKQTPLKKSA
jgi:uncharacterized membrane protein YhaH (DUF805 family)